MINRHLAQLHIRNTLNLYVQNCIAEVASWMSFNVVKAVRLLSVLQNNFCNDNSNAKESYKNCLNFNLHSQVSVNQNYATYKSCKIAHK